MYFSSRAALIALMVMVSSCGPQFDETQPAITEGPTPSIVRDTTATIAWLTNERANSLVEYGPDASYGTVEIDNLYLKAHVVTIRNLQPSSTYHLRALSYDIFGNGPVKSNDITINTLAPQPPPDVQITEVMYAPVSSTTGEFIEIYNNGSTDVDMTGFTFSDGDSTDTLKSFQGSSTNLSPGAYAVILDADYVVGTYTIDPGTVLLTTNDSTMGNALSTDDPIQLFAPGESVAASTYGTPLDAFDSIPITTAPTGFSIERRDPAVGDEAGNWCISVAASGSTPGAPTSGC